MAIKVTFRPARASAVLSDKKGVTRNLSYSGFLLVSSPYDSLPDEIRGELHLPAAEPVPFKGRVAWTGPFNPSVRQSGVRITEMDEGARRRFEEFRKSVFIQGL